MSRSQLVCLQIYSSSLESDLIERQRHTHTHTHTHTGERDRKRVEKRWIGARRRQERRKKRQKFLLDKGLYISKVSDPVRH